MRRRCLIVLAALLLAPLTGARVAIAADEATLRAGVLADATPFVVHGADGQITGFTIELFKLIAQRMNRRITFETAAEKDLYAGLARGQFDILPGPIAATPDRAAELLLTEGYIWSEFQFGARTGEPVLALGDLRGRRLAVRADSPYAEWSDRNAQRYGFTVVKASTGLEAAKAVLRREADASLGASPVQIYAASQDANFNAGLSLPETRTHESAAVRRADAELRDDMEDALQCLKMNGTVARLSRQWFGREPDAEDLENLVVPGYGVPGLAGYDPKPRKTRC